MPSRKSEIVTFKADAALVQALQAIGNRSEFIRQAVLSALENTCPLCGGSGILSESQKSHWDAFAQDHGVEECCDCHEPHLVCRHARA